MVKPYERESELEANRIDALQKQVNKARRFPTNTCPASRHLHIMADCLVQDGVYHMLVDEPMHCAGTMYSVLASLWEARTELAKIKKQVDDAKALYRKARGIKAAEPADTGTVYLPWKRKKIAIVTAKVKPFVALSPKPAKRRGGLRKRGVRRN